ncbi:MAG: CsgG/HfaB family protein [bacterium]
MERSFFSVPSIVMSLIFIFSISGCTQQYTKQLNRKDNGAFFRGRWYNYYKRALEYMDDHAYGNAITDLRKAIERREEDQRRARTYGMHLVDYFPHRELGIIHYRTGNLEEAHAELTLSLNQYPSAKARFYLDKVRKAIIEREGKIVSPPKLTLSYKSSEIWIREDPIVISGIAEDTHYVSEIIINDVPFYLRASQKHIPFEKKMRLSQGDHTIEVIAKNLMDKVTTEQIIIHVDREGPVIAVNEIFLEHDLTGDWVNINGSMYDGSGVVKLTINGRIIAIGEGTDVLFSHRIPIPADHLALVAYDRLENKTSAQISLSSLETKHSPMQIACISDRTSELLYATQVAPNGLAPHDTHSPEITIKDWTDTQTVFLEKIHLDGMIKGESNIVHLTINKRRIDYRPGKIIFFNRFLELKEGDNSITIEAEDEAGNQVSKTIAIKRNIPCALKLEERLCIAIFPFEQGWSISDLSLFFQANLINALFNRKRALDNQKRFRIVDREQLDRILHEHKLSRSNLINKKTAIKLGRILAAQSIISGNIYESSEGLEIVARIKDTETTELLATADVYGEMKDIIAIKHLAEALAREFHREFPFVNGLIIEKKGKKYIITDLGQDKTKANRRIIIYREEPFDNPEIHGNDYKIIDRAFIIKHLSDKESKAEMVNGKNNIIKSEDKVITQ